MRPIYIVDDSADQRLLLEYFTKRINPDYPIAFFERAQEMLDALAIAVEAGTTLPQIIILDLQMPGLNGYKALKTIKRPDQNEKYKDVPVAILSSYVDQTLIEQCLKAGALGFFHNQSGLNS